MKLFHSVKARLTFSYAIILAVLLSAFSAFMYVELSRTLYDDVDENLLYEALEIEKALGSHLTHIFRDIELKEDIDLSISSEAVDAKVRWRVVNALRNWEKSSRKIERSPFLVVLTGLDHTEILNNLQGWEQDIVFPDFERDSVFMQAGHSYQTIYYRRRPFRLYYHLVRRENRPLLIIQCGASTYELESSLNRLAFIILLTIPAGVLMACLAGWYQAKRSFAPIDQMIREANKITAAYLKRRLPRTQTGDELDRLAETLNEMMDRIEKTTRAIQEFSSDVSHELKTPLAIIRGEIDLALRRSRSPEDLMRTLRVIEEEVDELIRLVEDLMLLVRSDANQLRFEKQHLSLKQILEQVCERFRERVQKKNQTFELHIDQECAIDGDGVYLKRLFSNLIDNAVKFTQEGGRVAVTLNVKDQEATVEVADNGMGIEPDKQTKVFSRFYRTDSARAQEGSGLGLNIAKAICEVHRGSLALTSTVGKGTTVTVKLPLS